MTDIADLVARLRSLAKGPLQEWDILAEAADAMDALTAETARLKKILDGAMGDYTRLSQHAEEEAAAWQDALMLMEADRNALSAQVAVMREGK